MGHVIKVTARELETELRAATHGHLETALVLLSARMAKQANRRPVYIKAVFPQDGGIELRCRRGWPWTAWFWRFRNPIDLWEVGE